MVKLVQIYRYITSTDLTENANYLTVVSQIKKDGDLNILAESIQFYTQHLLSKHATKGIFVLNLEN